MNINKKIVFNKNRLIKIFDLIKKKSKINFIESIDVAINLFIDTKDINQHIKGCVLLPYGIGKKNKVVVFASEFQKDIAYSSGAFYVGSKDLFNKIKNCSIKYDVVISTLEHIKLVSKLGQLLGPKGLMPNIKLGTLTDNLKDSVSKFSKGQITYKNDKFGIIHSKIGKINFTSEHLLSNFTCFIDSVKLNRPSKLKSNFFFKKIFISSTMGKSYLVDLDNI